MNNNFAQSPLHEIVTELTPQIAALSEGDTLCFGALNPDYSSGAYAGEEIMLNGIEYIHRSYNAWVRLAELLGCRMLTPMISTDATVTIRYQKLAQKSSFHQKDNLSINEKYGTDSPFARINKLEEPTFLWAYHEALRAVKIDERNSILDLGINSGDEFIAIEQLLDHEKFSTISMVGIDHSNSAIKQAKALLPYPNVDLICHDINALHELGPGKFDLIISIGTLQSPDIETKPLIMSLVQQHLTDHGAIILGFPNARWIDGELVYGAKAPNYKNSELSLVIKDIYWIKKYLQQHRFRVTVTGREYLFLTATKIKGASNNR